MFRNIFIFAIVPFICNAAGERELAFKHKTVSVNTAVAQMNAEMLSLHAKQNWFSEFHVFGNARIEDAEIILIPEIHTDVFSKLVQAEVVHRLAREGDIVLGESEYSSKGKSECSLFATTTMLSLNVDVVEAFLTHYLREGILGRLLVRGLYWPHAKTMHCQGWDFEQAGKIHKSQSLRLNGDEVASAHAVATYFKDSDYFLKERDHIVRLYGLTLSELSLDKAPDFAKFVMTSYQVDSIASMVVRNRHLIAIIKKHRTSAPRARIFVFAGAAHFPPTCFAANCGEETFKTGAEIQLREIQEFLKGQKYVTLAHKELFVDPRGKFDKTEL